MNIGLRTATVGQQRLVQIVAQQSDIRVFVVQHGATVERHGTDKLAECGQQMREIVFWILGGLGRARWDLLPGLAGVVIFGVLTLMLFARDLNTLALGEEGARHLGVRPERLEKLLLMIVTLLTGAAVALAGTIGFVGLITPHALRLVVGPDHRVLLPASALAGAAFLVLADTAARTVLAPVELPVGILTALCGAPFFLYLLLTRRGGEMR